MCQATFHLWPVSGELNDSIVAYCWLVQSRLIYSLILGAYQIWENILFHDN